MDPTLFEIALYCYLRALEIARAIVSTFLLAIWCAAMRMQGPEK